MPDTPRTRAELVELFADNTTGGISAQDLRDFLASVHLTSEPGESDRTYVHDQGPASAVWTVTHGLGKHPAVTVVDTAGTEVYPQVDHLDINTVRLTFQSAMSGRAFFN